MSVRSSIALFVFSAVLVLLSALRGLAADFPYLFKDPLGVEDKLPKGLGQAEPGELKKDFSTPLTLDEAVDLALSRNPRVKSSWGDIKVQAGLLGESYGAYLPTLSGGVNWADDTIKYSDSRYPSTHTNKYTWQVSAGWKLFDFGGRSANRSYAEQLLASALAGHDATLQSVLSDLVQSYFDAITAHAGFSGKTRVEELAYRTYQSALDREGKGTISRSETLRAKTAHARALLDKNRAEGQYHKSLAVLRGQVGIAPDVALTVPVGLDKVPSKEVMEKQLSELLEEARKQHPAIISAQKQLDAAKERLTVVKSTGLPTLSLSTTYYQNTRQGEAVTATGARETTVILGVSIPLFEGFATTYKIMGERSRIEKQAAVLTDAEQKVARDIMSAHADAVAAYRNLGASLELLETAEQSLEVSQRKYGKGAADLAEVLSTQTALAEALTERVQCLADWNKSRLQLLAAVGRLDKSVLVNR